MVTEPPYPLEFELTLKGDPNKNFYIDINERTARADDVKQKITWDMTPSTKRRQKPRAVISCDVMTTTRDGVLEF